MKIFLIILIILIIAIIGILYYAGNFLFNGIIDSTNPWFHDVAHSLVNTDIDADHDTEIGDREKAQKQTGIKFWDQEDERCTIQSFDNLLLKGRIFLTDKPSGKWMLGFHGYRTDGKTDMGYICSEIVKMGYNCLIVDQRSHGESEGKYIGMGWLERKDVLAWTNYIIEEKNPDEIMWIGDSMGAATVMMASGEEVPDVVHGIIADCGYTSVKDLFQFLLKNSFKVPNWVPILPMFNLVNKRKLHFDVNDASSYKQLQKNDLPVLFIHGDADTFVPTFMTHENMTATKGEKEVVIVKDAPHFSSVLYDPKLYFNRIADFLHKYSR